MIVPVTSKRLTQQLKILIGPKTWNLTEWLIHILSERPWSPSFLRYGMSLKVAKIHLHVF